MASEEQKIVHIGLRGGRYIVQLDGSRKYLPRSERHGRRRPNRRRAQRGRKETRMMGVYHSIGGRSSQEDRYIMNTEGDWRVYSVFDGHGGDQVANVAADNLPVSLLQNAVINTKMAKVSVGSIIKLCETFDRNLEKTNPESGCTATILMWNAATRDLITVQIGDSRAIVFTYPDGRVLQETKDHKPQNAEERKRAVKTGSFVSKHCSSYDKKDCVWRIGGDLSVARAFGDYDTGLKKYDSSGKSVGPLVATPDVYEASLLDEKAHVYAVLACDGIWDVLSSGDVIKICLVALGKEVKLDTIAKELEKQARSAGSTDNVTVLVVKLSPS